MGYTHFPNGITAQGIPLLGGVIPPMNNTTGKVIYVNAKFGSDDNSGLNGWDNALETLVAAEDLATTGVNDIILLDGLKRSGGPTYKYQEDAHLAWDKDCIHVIGCGNWGAADPDPQISLNSTGRATDCVATMVVTGTGNTFTNMTWTGNGTHASNLCAVHDNGEGTVYTNCQFMKTNDLDSTSVCDVWLQGDTSTFRNCKFGAVWYTIEVARQNCLVNGSVGDRMKSCYFEDCYFVAATDDANFKHLAVSDTASMSMENIFKDCIFYTALITSESAVQATVAVASVSGLVEGSAMFVNCATNAGSFATTADQFTLIGHGLADSTTAAVGIAITPT